MFSSRWSVGFRDPASRGCGFSGITVRRERGSQEGLRLVRLQRTSQRCFSSNISLAEDEVFHLLDWLVSWGLSISSPPPPPPGAPSALALNGLWLFCC